MVLLARQALAHIEHALGGPMSSTVTGLTALNQAGEAMESARDWVYMARSTGAIGFRAAVTGTGAVVDTGAKTVFLADAFASYTVVPGDTVQLTDSSGVVTEHKILLRDDQDTLTLMTVPAGSPTVSFTVRMGRVQLPSDFGTIIKVFGTDGFTRTAFSGTTTELMRIDSLALVQNNFVTGYALEWNVLAEKSTPVPTLKIWPQPTVVDNLALSATYYRLWPELTSDADIISIPPYMETLYLQYVRAFALGYEGGVDLGAAVAQVQALPIFIDAARRDTAGQSDLGPTPKAAIRKGSRAHGYDPLGTGLDERLFQD